MRRFNSRKAANLSVDKAIRLFNQGDIQAFESIYRSYCEFVHRICLRMLRNPVEADDAAQDVFVCVFRKINTFRGESAFSSWLYRLTPPTPAKLPVGSMGTPMPPPICILTALKCD